MSRSNLIGEDSVCAGVGADECWQPHGQIAGELADSAERSAQQSELVIALQQAGDWAAVAEQQQLPEDIASAEHLQAASAQLGEISAALKTSCDATTADSRR